MNAELVTARHLSRKAVIYVRQSSPHQVLTNQESLRLQYGPFPTVTLVGTGPPTRTWPPCSAGGSGRTSSASTGTRWCTWSRH